MHKYPKRKVAITSANVEPINNGKAKGISRRATTNIIIQVVASHCLTLKWCLIYPAPITSSAC